MKSPKDERLILASFKSYPLTTMAVWNECEKQWAIPWLSDNSAYNAGSDLYFETEYLNDSELKAWAEIK